MSTKKAVHDTKAHFLNNALPSMLLNNPCQFWKVINPSFSSNLMLRGADEVYLSDDQCSFVSNEMFAKSSSIPVTSRFPVFPTCDFLPMFPVIIVSEGIAKIIDNLKMSSAAGTDIYVIFEKY